MADRLRSLGFVVLCLAAAFSGALIAGRTHAEIGPFDATTSLRMSLRGDTVVRLAPLGSLRLDTHDGPLELAVSADEVNATEARELIEGGVGLAEFQAEIAADARRAVTTTAARATAGAVAASVGVALLRGGGRRRLIAGFAAAAVVVTGCGATARLSWQSRALAQPTYSGLLEIAPQAIGSLEDVRAQYDAYRAQLTALIANLSSLYQAASDLPAFSPTAETVRVLHVSDLHLNPQGFDIVGQIARQFRVDAIADTGDINDWGTPIESRFVESIGDLGVPYLYVRGNHDSAATAAAVASQPGAIVLEGDTQEVAGLRFWGIGDPRFTPDKSEEIDLDEQAEIAAGFAGRVRRLVTAAQPVDVVLVHDPRVAERLTDEAGVVLAGHTHEPAVKRLSEKTLMLVEGSTGGAGLRTLDDGEPMPLTCTILYFDSDTSELRAYDRITVDGLGGTGARIQRSLVERVGDLPESEPGGRRMTQR